MKNITIYGDSIMRGTVPDRDFRYQFKFPQFLEKFLQSCNATVINRAQFGATISKGLRTVQRDLSRGEPSEYALVEYGGNDCNFDWAAISSAPDGEYCPATDPEEFLVTLEDITSLLQKNGVKPILMTLPPIDAERYLKFICRDGLSYDRILSWLGDVQMIYRYHELYSNNISKFAFENGLPLIDVRSEFLSRHDLQELISEDGIHPSEKGYDLLRQTFESVFLDGESSNALLMGGCSCIPNRASA